MKILQLIQRKQLRGAEMFAAQLSHHLAESGHEVMLVSLFPGAAELPFTGITHCLEASVSSRFWDLRSWRKLSELIRQFNPDIVQANAGDTLKFAVFSKFFFRWKAPVIFRNANMVSGFMTSSLKLRINKFLVGGLRHVISVSEECRLDFVRLYGFPESKTTMIPIGIEPGLTKGDLPGDVAGYFAGSRVLMNIASLVPEKNQERLLHIMKLLVVRFPDVRLLIAGDGKLRSYLETQISELGLKGHVILLGYRKDVLSLLPHAQVFILPSRVEGLPGSILEAFLCQVPVVAYDVGGIREVVSNEKTGWLVPKDDEGTFVAALEEALQPTVQRQAMVDAAYRLVTTAFTNAELARKFEQVYRMIKSTGS